MDKETVDFFDKLWKQKGQGYSGKSGKIPALASCHAGGGILSKSSHLRGSSPFTLHTNQENKIKVKIPVKETERVWTVAESQESNKYSAQTEAEMNIQAGDLLVYFKIYFLGFLLVNSKKAFSPFLPGTTHTHTHRALNILTGDCFSKDTGLDTKQVRKAELTGS